MTDQPFDDETRPSDPSDELAEQLVLAAMLDAPRVVQQVTQLVQPADFYQPQHEAICAAIYRLDADGHPIDIGAVAKALRAQLQQIGGNAYLFDLIAKMPSPAAAPYHAKTVARLAVQRRLIAAGTRLAHMGRATDDGDLQDILAAAEAEVAAVASAAQPDAAAVRVGDVLEDYLEELETGEEPPGVAWHTADLRRGLRPLRPGNLAIIAAYSGIGKSIAAWNYAAHAAIHEKRAVLFHALEMSRNEMLDRLIASEAKVDIGHITSRRMTDWDWEKVSQARGRIEDAPLHIDDTEGITLGMLRASIRRTKPDLAVLDQIPIMTPPDPRAPREQQVAAIAYGLKNIARAEQTAVLAVAQLNDEALKRSDKRPTMHDLRESRAITHAADLVVILHDESHLEKESPRAGEIDWIVVKQRGGTKPTITLANQLSFARHMDMAA